MLLTVYETTRFTGVVMWRKPPVSGQALPDQQSVLRVYGRGQDDFTILSCKIYGKHHQTFRLASSEIGAIVSPPTVYSAKST